MSEKNLYQNSNYNPHVEMQKEINKKIDKIDINKKVKVTSRAGQSDTNEYKIDDIKCYILSLLHIFYHLHS